jgi:hypothetical protein
MIYFGLKGPLFDPSNLSTRTEACILIAIHMQRWASEGGFMTTQSLAGHRKVKDIINTDTDIFESQSASKRSAQTNESNAYT